EVGAPSLGEGGGPADAAPVVPRINEPHQPLGLEQCTAQRFELVLRRPGTGGGDGEHGWEQSWSAARVQDWPDMLHVGGQSVQGKSCRTVSRSDTQDA